MNPDKIELTGPQKNELYRTLENPAWSPNFAATGELNPHMRVFVAYFDGTENDGRNTSPDKNKTLAYSLAKDLTLDGNTHAQYYPGVGTTDDYILAKLQAITGFGCKSNAEKAYSDLVEAAERWRREDPLTQVHVHMVGFSRGAATALHFANMVDRMGIRPVRGGAYHGRPVPKAFAPGSVRSSAVLLDTVATSQELVLDLAPPPTLISVLHLVAGSEERSLFPLTALGNSDELYTSDWSLVKGVKAPKSTTSFGKDGSFLYKRIHQIPIDGARHSDIGDGYKPDPDEGDGCIGRACKYLALEFQSSLGLNVTAPNRLPMHDIQNAFGHDSRFWIDKVSQGISGVFGKEASREKVKRSVKKTAPPPWDGTLIQTASISIKKGNKNIANTKTRACIAPPKDAPLPDEKACAKRHRLDYHPASETRPEHFSSRSGRFKIQTDEVSGTPRLLFDGVIIDDLENGEDSVFANYMKTFEPSSLTGEDDAFDLDIDLHVDISYKKQLIPLHDYGQKLKASNRTMNLDQSKQAIDPWPRVVKEAIWALNASERSKESIKNDEPIPSKLPKGVRPLMEEFLSNPSNPEASKVLAACIDEVNGTLKKEFPDIETIQIRHRKFGSVEGLSKRGKSPLVSDEIDIICNGLLSRPKEGDGPLGNLTISQLGKNFSIRSKCTNGHQMAVQTRIRELSDALNTVRNLFAKRGFDVAIGLQYEASYKEAKSPRIKGIKEALLNSAALELNHSSEFEENNSDLNRMRIH